MPPTAVRDLTEGEEAIEAASQSWTADNFKDMGKWIDALITDTFA